jgi:ribosomal protein S18 acetylase RimI-like enzyme
MIPVRSKNPDDQPWVEGLLQRLWGDRTIVVHGEAYDAGGLPALIAGERQGLATFALAAERGYAELITLNALAARQGVGTALVEALAARLAASGIREIRLTMTNDNLDALRFYQRRGFRIAAIRPGAVDEARRIKPSIPVVGNYRIPRHDEIEMVRVWG